MFYLVITVVIYKFSLKYLFIILYKMFQVSDTNVKIIIGKER